jgi:hypothetical protein
MISFHGKFLLNAPLSEAQRDYLSKFSETRRMQRDASKTSVRPDPLRVAVGLPVGVEGGYFVGSVEFAGQEDSSDVVDYNLPPQDQPGLWCHWEPSEDGTAIQWNGTEKFVYHVEWLVYLIHHFLTPWGFILNGNVRWMAPDDHETGVLRVTNNEVCDITSEESGA